MPLRLRIPSKETLVKGGLAALATILLGAIGSGIWSWLLAPSLQWAGRIILNLASLGFHSYKDGVYRQISADYPTQTGTQMLLLTIFLYYSVIMAAGFAGLIRNDNLRRKLSDAAKRLSELPTSPNDIRSKEKATINWEIANLERQDLLKENKSIQERLSRLRKLVYAAFFMIVISFGNHLVILARLSYVTSAVSHYHQVLKVASPYIDAQDRLVFESQFAQIRSQHDYIKVVEKLESTCRDHGQKIPDFVPW